MRHIFQVLGYGYTSLLGTLNFSFATAPGMDLCLDYSEIVTRLGFQLAISILGSHHIVYGYPFLNGHLVFLQ
jgi:hypothetical protein